MKNTISELKNTVEVIKRRLDEAKDWISGLEDKVKKKLPERARTGTNTKKNEDRLREMQENMKCNNILVIGTPEGEEEREIENLFEKVMIENFPNLMREKSHKSRKHIGSQSRGTQRGPLQDTS